MNKVCIKVNGKEYVRNISSDTRLIDFLRDELNLKGTKESCGEGECGACTVIMDGKTVNSCLILAGAVEGANITTIEGIEDKQGKLIQKAFIECGAVQCGFCTPGMILSAKALLDSNPHASEEEMAESISGNLCRCTGYAKIIDGIKLAQKLINENE